MADLFSHFLQVPSMELSLISVRFCYNGQGFSCLSLRGVSRVTPCRADTGSPVRATRWENNADCDETRDLFGHPDGALSHNRIIHADDPGFRRPD